MSPTVIESFERVPDRSVIHPPTRVGVTGVVTNWKLKVWFETGGRASPRFRMPSVSVRSLKPVDRPCKSQTEYEPTRRFSQFSPSSSHAVKSGSLWPF